MCIRDRVNIYAHQAFALQRGGVDLLIADTMTTLSQSRAAILGCRQTGLPVMVTLNVEEDGETCMGSDLVSALIVCQKLGAAAFGLSCCDRPEKLYHHIEEIAPYAKVPIIAVSYTHLVCGRTCSICSSQVCQDRSFCFSLCCNYAVCTLCKLR